MPKYIIVADIHLKRNVPTCRTENDQEWLDLQRKTLDKLKEYTIETDSTLVVAGDIFDNPVASVTVLDMFISTFYSIRDRVLISSGNHDLPQHSIDKLKECSYGVLCNFFKQIPDLGEDSEIGGHDFNTEYKGKHYIIVTHQLVMPSEKDIEIIGSGKTPKALLKEYPHAKWIFTGDYHHKFVYKKGDRIVLNPGCSTRQSVKYAEYEPICYFVDTDELVIKELPLPDNDPASISTEHRDKSNARDERMSAFLEVVRKKGTVSLDFIENLEKVVNKKATFDEISKLYPEVNLVSIRDELSNLINKLRQDAEND